MIGRRLFDGLTIAVDPAMPEGTAILHARGQRVTFLDGQGNGIPVHRARYWTKARSGEWGTHLAELLHDPGTGAEPTSIAQAYADPRTHHRAVLPPVTACPVCRAVIGANGEVLMEAPERSATLAHWRQRIAEQWDDRFIETFVGPGAADWWADKAAQPDGKQILADITAMADKVAEAERIAAMGPRNLAAHTAGKPIRHYDEAGPVIGGPTPVIRISREKLMAMTRPPWDDTMARWAIGERFRRDMELAEGVRKPSSVIITGIGSNDPVSSSEQGTEPGDGGDST